MKKKIKFGLIGLSAILFIYLFVKAVISSIQIFSNPEGFSLLPILWAVIYLVILMCHVGLYVMIMDKKEMNHVVQDDDKWWERWDRV